MNWLSILILCLLVPFTLIFVGYTIFQLIQLAKEKKKKIKDNDTRAQGEVK